jgi:hypothetical protein
MKIAEQVRGDEIKNKKQISGESLACVRERKSLKTVAKL